MLPLLVLGLALGVLALHQLSHGRSLVVTDPAVAGHHAIAASAGSSSVGSSGAGSSGVGAASVGASVAAVVATAYGHVMGGESGAQSSCGLICEHPSSAMVCLLALVLLAGCRLLRGPTEVPWFVLSRAARRVGLRVPVDRGRAALTSSVSLLALGVSRT